MRAVTFQGPKRIEVRDMPTPDIEEPTDAILKVATAAICGSDLHLYHGRVEKEPGFIIGHEIVGIVEEVGPQVQIFKPGDRVGVGLGPVCGRCFYCRHRLSSQCVHRNVFGFGDIPGGQAEYFRVPFVDTTAELLPESLPDEEAILVTDIIPTGYFCAENGGIQPGDTVAVIGCGPIGLFTLISAQLFGPSLVLAIDNVPERLELARKKGAVPINFDHEDPVAKIKELTDGRGADVVCEAVGSETSLKSTFYMVRRGGTISVAGVFVERHFDFPIGRAFDRGLTFRIGMCNVKEYMARLFPLIQRRRVDPSGVVTHVLPLEEAPRGYDIFAHHKDKAIKVLLKP